MSASRTLPAPALPAGSPLHAQWLAGEGAGSWFVVTPAETGVLLVDRCDPQGRSECRGRFVVADGSISFDPAKPYVVTYPSHCAVLTLLQDGHRITCVPIS